MLDAETLALGLNFTLTTTLGDLDPLGEVTGGGGYEDLLPHTRRIRVFDTEVVVVTLPQLIRLKRAAGRPRDLVAVAELEVLLEEQSLIRSRPDWPRGVRCRLPRAGHEPRSRDCHGGAPRVWWAELRL